MLAMTKEAREYMALRARRRRFIADQQQLTATVRGRGEQTALQ
jgi:hypothetical protein